MLSALLIAWSSTSSGRRIGVGQMRTDGNENHFPSNVSSVGSHACKTMSRASSKISRVWSIGTPMIPYCGNW